MTVGTATKFHVALDDVPGGPSALVVMRLYDAAGNVVAETPRQPLPAGRTLTLEHRGGGLLRAQATVMSPLLVSGRRRTVATMEFDNANGFATEIPVSCAPPNEAVR